MCVYIPPTAYQGPWLLLAEDDPGGRSPLFHTPALPASGVCEDEIINAFWLGRLLVMSEKDDMLWLLSRADNRMNVEEKIIQRNYHSQKF